MNSKRLSVERIVDFGNFASLLTTASDIYVITTTTRCQNDILLELNHDQ